ncbi:MAG: hypothetical protein R2800_01610 [Flavipsychrobacter sp.]
MKYLITILCLLLMSSANAQIIKRKKAKADEKAPKAILVQLFTNQNKLAYLQERKKTDDIQLLKKDTDSILTKMVRDFNDNFYYCPVYYYIDSNIEHIRKKEFDGILLNENLQPVKNTVLENGATDFQIVIFGYPIQKSSDNLKDDEKDDFFASNYSVTTKYKQRLVVFDHNFDKLPLPLPNGSNNVYGGALKHPAESYLYTSKKFPLYYKPYAKSLSAKMYDFYGSYPYKK